MQVSCLCVCPLSVEYMMSSDSFSLWGLWLLHLQGEMRTPGIPIPTGSSETLLIPSLHSFHKKGLARLEIECQGASLGHVLTSGYGSHRIRIHPLVRG